MRTQWRGAFVALLAIAVLAGALGTGAAGASNEVGAAYTITNSPAGNAVAVYTRSSEGALTPAGTVPTGGVGTGAGLASQGAVVVTDDGQTVLAVNPGSNTVSALAVEGDGLRLLGSAPSGGNRPVSVAVHKDLVYVLNKDNATPATVSALRLSTVGLTAIAGSTRQLFAGATDAAQVQFTPDGSTLVVTGRSSQRIDTFRIDADGLASNLKSFDVSPGAVPFGFDFDNKGHLLVSLAGVGPSSGAASYAVAADGTVSTISAPIATGERAACWLVASNDGRFAFVANAASQTVSSFAVAPDGSLTFLSAVSNEGRTALDEALSRNSRYLYVLAGNGIVGFEVGADGSLTRIGAQADVPPAAAGLAAR
jgi:6-phosphogluconolactonase